jgi:hypothetical protein
MANFHQKTFEHNETTYTFQFPGVRAVTQIRDRIKNKHGIASDEKLSEEVFKHVIVEPKVTFDSFDNFKDYETVVGAAINFLFGVDDEDDKQE